MMPRLAGLLLCAAATASDVLFVHVGKTCGGTIAAEFRKNHVAYHEVHLDKVDRETLAQYKHIIVCARPRGPRDLGFQLAEPARLPRTEGRVHAAAGRREV